MDTVGTSLGQTVIAGVALRANSRLTSQCEIFG